MGPEVESGLREVIGRASVVRNCHPARLTRSSSAVVLCGLLASVASGQNDRTYVGVYRNDTYLYEVTVPPGMTARGTAAPNPNHGFTIDLEVADRRGSPYKTTDLYLWVDGSYRPADGVDTLDNAVDYGIRMAQASIRAPVHVESRTAASLDGLRALRVVSNFQIGGTTIIRVSVTALNGAFMYTAGVQTIAKRREGDLKLLAEVLASFRLVHPGR
jgi:hypothetical protein